MGHADLCFDREAAPARKAMFTFVIGCGDVAFEERVAEMQAWVLRVTEASHVHLFRRTDNRHGPMGFHLWGGVQAFFQTRAFVRACENPKDSERDMVSVYVKITITRRALSILHENALLHVNHLGDAGSAIGLPRSVKTCAITPFPRIWEPGLEPAQAPNVQPTAVVQHLRNIRFA